MGKKVEKEINELVEEFFRRNDPKNIKSMGDMYVAWKDFFAPAFQQLLDAEMEAKHWDVLFVFFKFSAEIRKIMYTTNAIESVNSSFRKVTKRGSFPNENSLFKLLYLRVTELYKKWKDRSASNWAMVRNQIAMNPNMQSRITKNIYTP